MKAPTISNSASSYLSYVRHYYWQISYVEQEIWRVFGHDLRSFQDCYVYRAGCNLGRNRHSDSETANS